MELKVIRMNIPEGSNLILGQSHFIKTAEDLYEVMAGTAPGAKFGIAFSEASGDCLIRSEGNDMELIEGAKKNSLSLSCGHTFVVLMKGAFPINVLNAIKGIPGGLQHLLRHSQSSGGSRGRDRPRERDHGRH